jgi:hypothetical protein
MRATGATTIKTILYREQKKRNKEIIILCCNMEIALYLNKVFWHAVE